MDQSATITDHPDLQELRSRYEQASETRQGQLLEGTTMLAGVYAAMSPWILSFAATSSNIAISNLISGLTVALLAIGFVTAYGRTHNLAWTTPCLGAWIVVSHWVIAGSSVGLGVLLTNVITGGLIVVLGAGIAGLGMMRRK